MFGILTRSRYGMASSFVRWSHYRPEFVDPVYKKAKIEKMYEDGTAKDMTFLPIKAAQNFEHDSIFHDPLAIKFTNIIMKCGQRELARSLLDRTFENIKRIQLEKYYKASEAEREKIECNPFKILHKAIANCTPVITLNPVKRGGTTYRVPMAVSESTARFRAMKWLLEACSDKKRRNIKLPEKLSWELIDAANNEGRAVKFKQDLHQQCEANKAYAHYRWT